MEKNNSNEKITGKGKKSVFIIALVAMFIFTIFSLMASITFGNADISLQEVYSVIGYELFKMNRFAAYSTGAVHDVVWLIRFPRVVLALAVGMGLSICGVVMQAIVQNPLADPYILGVSSGATVTSFAVMAIANMGGRATAGKLILTGTAVSSVCSAFSNFIIYMQNDNNATSEVMHWTMGSLSGAEWGKVKVILPVILICTIIFWSQYRNLNLMLLGDEVSITLGTNLQKYRTIYLVIAAVMVGFAVYTAGMIGFVGLIIPHVVRILFGTDHRRLIPFSALLGGTFLIWSDVACRTILKNAEIPIGILVSLIGAPCFIYLLVNRSYGFGGGKS